MELHIFVGGSDTTVITVQLSCIIEGKSVGIITVNHVSITNHENH